MQNFRLQCEKYLPPSLCSSKGEDLGPFLSEKCAEVYPGPRRGLHPRRNRLVALRAASLANKRENLLASLAGLDAFQLWLDAKKVNIQAC